jgi:hypothetical protein
MAKSRKSCSTLTLTDETGADPERSAEVLDNVVTILRGSMEAAEYRAREAERAIIEEFQAIRGEDADPWDEPSFYDENIGDRYVEDYRAEVDTQPEDRREGLLADLPEPSYDYDAESQWGADRLTANDDAKERLGFTDKEWISNWLFVRPTEHLADHREARVDGQKSLDPWLNPPVTEQGAGLGEVLAQHAVAEEGGEPEDA